MRKFGSAIILAGLLSAMTANALTAKQIVEREVIVQSEDGRKIVKREAADKVVPGERVVYSLEYFNDGDKPVNDIVLVMPVPKEIKYLDNSAETKQAETLYSVDGGKEFAKRDQLTVKLANGGSRSARAADITHIRWTINNEVAPGAKGTLEFKGLLK
ncbi:MAG TPA: hypothetical protein ENJ42_02600 [Hellea balneolensis]|uniref:DUF11 domain-containing protein n=1 Tax=Hellea balneolensis TaxID=287478 RepID=A0A7C5R042_9PROT|nr:hypothetical protein [Hellea balneolensis]